MTSADKLIFDLQTRYRRHLGNYQAIATANSISPRMIYRFTSSPPRAANFTLNSLRLLEEALDYYESSLEVEQRATGS